MMIPMTMTAIIAPEPKNHRGRGGGQECLQTLFFSLVFAVQCTVLYVSTELCLLLLVFVCQAQAVYIETACKRNNQLCLMFL